MEIAIGLSQDADYLIMGDQAYYFYFHVANHEARYDDGKFQILDFSLNPDES